MSALALDIGTYSFKAIHAKPGKKPVIERVVEARNPVKIAVPSDEAALDKLARQLDGFLNDNSLPRGEVRLAVPEAIVSTKVIEMPPLTDAELASAISWQAEQHIPIPPAELSLEYHVLFRPAKKEQKPMRVLLVGARRQVIERYVDMFNRIGIEPSIIETNILAGIRSLGVTQEDPPTLLAHIGASAMELAMLSRDELAFVVSHLSGGQMLNQALEKSIGLSSDQAEEYKQAFGLDETQLQGKVSQALRPAVDVLTSEIYKAVQFYVSQHPQAKVQRIVLSGGTAQMPGLVQHLTTQIGAEVLVAAPFASATGQVPQVPNQAAYTVCMGLLQRKK